MYEDICYKKSFLKEVIIRIDFSAPISELTSNLPRQIGNRAVERFPISEPKKGFHEALQISPADVKRERSEFTEWNFYGRDREKRLVISPTSLLISVSRYSAFEGLQDDFLYVLQPLFSSYPDARGQRFGLRYINRIDLELADPLSWEEYINDALLGLYKKFHDRETLSRLFHIVDFRFDELILRFQFGMPNPDFPATIKQSIFVIDLDAYVQGLQDITQISTNITKAHEVIQNRFEDTIKDKLRGIMNA